MNNAYYNRDGLFCIGEGLESGVCMNFVEILLSEKLKNRNGMLDVFGSDRKVLQIACQDLTNFLKVHWNLVGVENSECALTERIDQFFKGNPQEMEEFMEVWTGIWLRKWGERVKLMIGGEHTSRWNKVSKMLTNAEPLWRKLSNSQEMIDVVVSTLVKNGEICGTSILAENLLKMEMGDENSEVDCGDEKQVMSVVNNVLRKARDLAHTKGPLIFVKVDKAYYHRD
jgi:hypothetical protein